MDDPFVGIVIGIVNQRLNPFGEFFFGNRVAMVLGGDVAAFSANFNSRLVLGAMTEFKLIGIASGS